MVRRSITDEQIGAMHRRANDLIRRTIEGTIGFEPTMDVLQDAIEGRYEPVETSKAATQICEVFSGCRCTICGGFFGDSALDTVCASGHIIGREYPA